jgi:hypothetical protein
MSFKRWKKTDRTGWAALPTRNESGDVSSLINGQLASDSNHERTMAIRRISQLLALSLGLLLLSCGKNLPPPVNVVSQDQVFYSDESHMTEVSEMVIRDLDTWRQVWGQITGGEAAPPEVDFGSRMLLLVKAAPPEVDFGSRMLLLVNGGRMDPGDRIQIDRLEYRGEELVAMYRVIEDCGTLESDVFPIQVVAVPRRGGEVRFEGQHVRAPHCR